ncbi:hypothetical protein ACIRFH_03835 [Streptomyces sp. NPDC093586]|uniref:hypothetical protein n=1 Tax=Streptomyces sp. NPDC093586 TaxID=3366042 RepID=UPI00381798C9
MAEDTTSTYQVSAEYLQGFARDKINGLFLEQFREEPYIKKLRGYGGQGGSGEYDELLTGNPDSVVTSAKALREDFKKFATDMVTILEGLQDGMKVLSDKVIGVNHITQQGEQEAKDLALQSMMDDLREPLALFSGSGKNTQPTAGNQPTSTGS